MIYLMHNEMSTNIGNIRVNSNDTIVNWWKLSRMNGGISIDSNYNFSEVFKNSIFRSSTGNNFNLKGEQRFTIVSHDQVLFKIRLNQEIPISIIYDQEQGGTTYGWYVMKDGGSACLVSSIDEDRLGFTYSGIQSNESGQYLPGDVVIFFNPFMNYYLPSDSPMLIVTKDWCSNGLFSAGMWQKRSGEYRMIVYGISDDDEFSLSLLGSDDLVSWELLNGEDYIYRAGEFEFDILEVCSVGGELYPVSNPVKIEENLYISFMTMGDAGSTGIGWIKHDEDFSIIETCTSWMDFGNFNDKLSPSAVRLGDSIFLYYIDKVSDNQLSWRVMESKIDNFDSLGVTYTKEVPLNNFRDTWNSEVVNSVVATISRGDISLLVWGSGVNIPYSLYIGNTSVGLINRSSLGEFEVDSISPVLVAPINGDYFWGLSGFTGYISSGLPIWWTETGVKLFLNLGNSNGQCSIFETTIFTAEPT